MSIKCTWKHMHAQLYLFGCSLRWSAHAAGTTCPSCWSFSNNHEHPCNNGTLSLSLPLLSLSLSHSKTTPVLPLPVRAYLKFLPCNYNCYSPVNFSELYSFTQAELGRSGKCGNCSLKTKRNQFKPLSVFPHLSVYTDTSLSVGL